MGLFYTEDGTIVDGENDILSLRELSFALDKSRSTLRRWREQGLPYISFSNEKGYNLKDVEEWLSIHKHYPPSYLTKRWALARITLKKLEDK